MLGSTKLVQTACSPLSKYLSCRSLFLSDLALYLQSYELPLCTLILAPENCVENIAYYASIMSHAQICPLCQKLCLHNRLSPTGNVEDWNAFVSIQVHIRFFVLDCNVYYNHVGVLLLQDWLTNKQNICIVIRDGLFYLVKIRCSVVTICRFMVVRLSDTHQASWLGLASHLSLMRLWLYTISQITNLW